MRSCSYKGCSVNEFQNPGLSFFYFPSKDMVRREAWIRNSGRDDLRNLPFGKLKFRRICEKHFRKEYVYSVSNNRKKILWNAVPFPFESEAKSESNECSPIPENTIESEERIVALSKNNGCDSSHSVVASENCSESPMCAELNKDEHNVFMQSSAVPDVSRYVIHNDIGLSANSELNTKEPMQCNDPGFVKYIAAMTCGTLESGLSTVKEHATRNEEHPVIDHSDTHKQGDFEGEQRCNVATIPEDFSSKCRLCTSDCGEGLTIFESSREVMSDALVKMKLLLSPEISENDGFPYMVCDECLKKLNEFSKFREQCMMSKQEFRAVLSNLPKNTCPFPDDSIQLRKDEKLMNTAVCNGNNSNVDEIVTEECHDQGNEIEGCSNTEVESFPSDVKKIEKISRNLTALSSKCSTVDGTIGAPDLGTLLSCQSDDNSMELSLLEDNDNCVYIPNAESSSDEEEELVTFIVETD